METLGTYLKRLKERVRKEIVKMGYNDRLSNSQDMVRETHKVFNKYLEEDLGVHLKGQLNKIIAGVTIIPSDKEKGIDVHIIYDNMAYKYLGLLDKNLVKKVLNTNIVGVSKLLKSFEQENQIVKLQIIKMELTRLTELVNKDLEGHVELKGIEKTYANADSILTIVSDYMSENLYTDCKK